MTVLSRFLGNQAILAKETIGLWILLLRTCLIMEVSWGEGRGTRDYSRTTFILIIPWWWCPIIISHLIYNYIFISKCSPNSISASTQPISWTHCITSLLHWRWLLSIRDSRDREGVQQQLFRTTILALDILTIQTTRFHHLLLIKPTLTLPMKKSRLKRRNQWVQLIHPMDHLWVQLLLPLHCLQTTPLHHHLQGRRAQTFWLTTWSEGGMQDLRRTHWVESKITRETQSWWWWCKSPWWCPWEPMLLYQIRRNDCIHWSQSYQILICRNCFPFNFFSFISLKMFHSHCKVIIIWIKLEN